MFVFKFGFFLAVSVVMCQFLWYIIQRILRPVLDIYNYKYSKSGKLNLISRDIEKEDRRVHPNLRILPLKRKNKRKYMLARGIGAPLPVLRQLGYELWFSMPVILITLVVFSFDCTLSGIYNKIINILNKVLDLSLIHISEPTRRS